MNQATNAVEIGNRINSLRRSRNLSLREMAEKSGLTASFLSQVERGIVNTSIDSLRRITDSLNISMVELLSESIAQEDAPIMSQLAKLNTLSHSHNGARLPASSVVRANKRPTLHFPDSGVTYEMLTNSRINKVEVFLSKLLPGTDIQARPLSEPTEEFVYVIDGSLRVELTDQSYVLNAGDSLYFDGTIVTRFVCVGDQVTSVIFMITPPVF